MNGALAYFTFPQTPMMPLTAKGPCVAFDTAGTSFFLPLITCLVLTSLTRRAARGKPPALAREQLPAFARLLPRNMVGRGALVGLLCMAAVAPLTIALLSAFGVAGFDRAGMTIYKCAYTAVLGAIVTPLFGLRALADGDSAATSRATK
jgi:hypothetical protein